MEIHNTTKGDLGLGLGYVVPAGGSLDIDPAEMEKLANSPVVQAWAESGWIVEGGGVELADQKHPITRETVADMEKAEMVEILEGHGVDVDKRLGEDNLRKQVVELLFVDV